MADLSWDDGSPVTPAPRSILARQIDRLAERGLVPYVGTELEFMVFDDTYREAWSLGYRGLDAGHRLQRRLRDAWRRPGWSRCCATSGSA